MCVILNIDEGADVVYFSVIRGKLITQASNMGESPRNKRNAPPQPPRFRETQPGATPRQPRDANLPPDSQPSFQQDQMRENDPETDTCSPK